VQFISRALCCTRIKVQSMQRQLSMLAKSIVKPTTMWYVAALTLLASSGAVAQVERFTGCYDIILGSWSPADPGGDSIYYAPPTRVRLTTEPGKRLGGAPHGYAVTPTPGAMPSLHEYSWWVLNGDSVAIHWTTGFSGVSVRLAGQDTLRGAARTLTDVVSGPIYATDVSAPRVDCSGPLDETRQLRHRFPPIVHLTDGDSLVLDGSVNSALVLSRPSARSLFVRGTPHPPYDGANQVEVWLREDDSIRAIRLHYAPGIGFDELLARLTGHLGAPTSSPRTPPRRVAIWSSRLLYISVSENLPSNDSGLIISVHSQRRW
jgi:hypothetical protein